MKFRLSLLALFQANAPCILASGFFNIDGYMNSRTMWGAYTVGLGSLLAAGVFSMSK